MDQAEPGWAHRINEARLNMASKVDDVFGQLTGTYEVGRDRYLGGQPAEQQVELGFFAGADGDVGVAFAALTNAWRTEVATRKAKAAAA